MLSSNVGWFDWAARVDGPPDKTRPETNLIQGVVFHSAVGTLQGVINVVMGPTSNQKSVTGVIGYDGRLVQFYPVTASPWANGNPTVNIRYLGFEFEGGRIGNESEPLTLGQVDSAVRILKDLAEYKGVGVDYWKRPTTLVEHRELVATACPSGRIPWAAIVAALQPIVPTAAEQSRVLSLEGLRVANFQLGFALPELTARDKAVLDWLNKKEQAS